MTRTYWRIPVVAILGALLAFLSSYLVTTTYQSSTRLIIHGRDANFLSSSGTSNAVQSTIPDTTTAKALADTYGSIATSRALAITVVDDLKLDAPSTDSGFFHDVAGVFATAYRCTRGFLTSGSCPPVSRREQAINDVQTGTTALQLGTTAGDTAGQAGAYVLELTASGDSPEQAQQITNTLARELVNASSQLVATDLQSYITKLRANLRTQNAAIGSATKAITDYEAAHHISAADQQLAVTASAYSDLQSERRDAHNDLVTAQAKLGAINSAISNTSSTTSTGQTISTGRSDTSITSSERNPTYSDLLTQRNQTQAEISGLKARITSLDNQVAAASPANLDGRLAALANLQEDLTNARKSQASVTSQLQNAETSQATAQPDLSRIDVAGRPTYPTSPKRYLYLLIGLLLGALAGGALTWRAQRQLAPDLADDDEFGDGLDDTTDADDDEYPINDARPSTDGVGEGERVRQAQPEQVDAMALLGFGDDPHPAGSTSRENGAIDKGAHPRRPALGDEQQAP